jgi:hypothetical protein
MLTQASRPASGRLRFVRTAAIAALGLLALGVSACDKMPLVAPTGTIITLYPNSTVLAPGGSIEIRAVAIEGGSAPATGNGGGTATGGQGTPVHNGTVITFTTTLGRIEPQEARTHNGQATVRLHADGQSGVASVRAFSGGASSNELRINVGAAAAKTVFLSSTPQTLGSAGGTAQISARVVDENGTNLAGVPVTFTADNGTLSQSVVNTDASGLANTSLTTSRETVVTARVSSDVTAEVTVRLNPRINVTITPPATPPTAGISSNFQIGVGSNANVTNVRVNWGDGVVQDLGAISGTVTVPHRYNIDGDFTVSATAFDANGSTESVSTMVSVLPQQPPSVVVTSSNSNPFVDDVVTLTASVSGAASTIQSYRWDLGNCSNPPSPVIITSNRLNVSWSCIGTKFITVTVEQSSGPAGIGQGAVTVQ